MLKIKNKDKLCSNKKLYHWKVSKCRYQKWNCNFDLKLRAQIYRAKKSKIKIPTYVNILDCGPSWCCFYNFCGFWHFQLRSLRSFFFSFLVKVAFCKEGMTTQMCPCPWRAMMVDPQVVSTTTTTQVYNMLLLKENGR